MPRPLKKHEELNHHEPHQDTYRQFQDFKDISNHSAKLKELIFFGRIAIFSLVTVLFAFVLLVMNLTPLWAFLFASTLSLAVTSMMTKIIKSFLS